MFIAMWVFCRGSYPTSPSFPTRGRLPDSQNCGQCMSDNCHTCCHWTTNMLQTSAHLLCFPQVFRTSRSSQQVVWITTLSPWETSTMENEVVKDVHLMKYIYIFIYFKMEILQPNILVLLYQRVNSVDPFRLNFGNGHWLRTQLDLPGCMDTLDLANTWRKIKRVGGTQSGYIEIRFEFLGINSNGNGNSICIDSETLWKQLVPVLRSWFLVTKFYIFLAQMYLFPATSEYCGMSKRTRFKTNNCEFHMQKGVWSLIREDKYTLR